MSLKNYKESLKKTSGASEEKKVKVLEKDSETKKNVRNLNIPTAYSKEEKEWLEKQAALLSEELGFKITVSGFIRNKALAGMRKD